MVDDTSRKVVRLAHGAGGKLQTELIEFITRTAKHKRYKGGVGVEDFDDGGSIPKISPDMELIVTADGHTVHPLEFPGGNLGLLAAAGTINDVLMMGGDPIVMTSTVLVEEGLSFEILGRVMDSFNAALNAAEVALIAGDTKVMPRGSLQGLVISTTGIGLKPRRFTILDKNVQDGDHIIMTGSAGDHGVALLAFREGLDFQTELASDVCVLKPLLLPVIEKFGANIHAMKDPTRGGLASALNEWARKSNVSVWLEEDEVLIKKEVRAACEMLGLDPLEVASEGRGLLAVSPDSSQDILALLQSHPLGKEARIIGKVGKDHPGTVFMKTIVGGTRFIDEPVGALIPRIC